MATESQHPLSPREVPAASNSRPDSLSIQPASDPASTIHLTCERKLWQALSWFGTTRVATPLTTKPPMLPTATSRMIGIVIAVLVVLPIPFVVQQALRDPAAVAGTATAVVTVLVLAVLVGGLALVTHALGSAWWAFGAGAPVVEVDAGSVRGGLHSARRGETPYQGWDFEVPLDQVKGVRLTPRGEIAIALPDEVERALLADPCTHGHTEPWRRATGSPASWPARRMLRRTGRDERLHRLFDAVSTAITTDGEHE